MYTTDPDPTPDQRRSTIAAILANGLLRSLSRPTRADSPTRKPAAKSINKPT